MYQKLWAFEKCICASKRVCLVESKTRVIAIDFEIGSSTDLGWADLRLGLVVLIQGCIFQLQVFSFGKKFFEKFYTKVFILNTHPPTTVLDW